MDIISKKQLHILSFRTVARFFFLIDFGSSHTFLKKQEIYSEAAAQVFTVSAQNIHTLREDFSKPLDGYEKHL